jgi:hypothetical protein
MLSEAGQRGVLGSTSVGRRDPSRMGLATRRVANPHEADDQLPALDPVALDYTQRSGHLSRAVAMHCKMIA